MPLESSGWPEQWLEQLKGDLTPAAVLIPLVERQTNVSVILTQRAAELKHHAGQVSFPGGRMEMHDGSAAETALRETHEEVGIAPEQVSVIGYLSTMPTITGYAVTPVVGLLRGEPAFAIDHSEVEYAFEVPLNFLLDSHNDVLVEREIHDTAVSMVEFHWENERIWGATAMMILMLRKVLLNK